MELDMSDTKILTGAEVKALAKAVRTALGPTFAALTSGLGVRAEDGIRFHAVATKCSISRESRGVTVKDVAATLRVPQYRLKAIERCSLREVRGEVLERYAAFLELDEWLSKWAAANPRLAVELNLTAARRSRTKRSHAPVVGSLPSNKRLHASAAAVPLTTNRKVGVRPPRVSR
jgi:hypothetical protein